MTKSSKLANKAFALAAREELAETMKKLKMTPISIAPLPRQEAKVEGSPVVVESTGNGFADAQAVQGKMLAELEGSQEADNQEVEFDDNCDAFGGSSIKFEDDEDTDSGTKPDDNDSKEAEGLFSDME